MRHPREWFRRPRLASRKNARLFAAIVVVSALLFALHFKIKRFDAGHYQEPPITVVTPQQTASSSTIIGSKPSPEVPTALPSIKKFVNIAVPFTPQAPSANWDEFHEEACEEASAVMVWHYFNQTQLGSTDEVDSEIMRAAEWERANVGTDVSISAKDAVRMLREHFSLDARLMTTVSDQAFKEELSSGNLIIVPAQGQFLKNPYFTQPGPRYHMLVIRGYTEDGRYVTNDPGTKRGEAYIYNRDILFDAIHDWNGGEVESGAKVSIVISGTL